MTTPKDSILIIEVSLECEKCYKKIQKVLGKLQSKESIRKIDFENKKNTVTISGPFDPVKLSKKLRREACEAIKDIKIVKPQEEKKAGEKKPEAKKPEEKKPETKKPEEKKPDEKKPEEKKSDEKKPEDKKPEDKKGGGKEKIKDDEKATAAAPSPWSSTTTVNLQFTHMCGICYPWPCRDPAAHWGGQPQLPQPQWPPSEGMVPAPFPTLGHHQQPPWGAAPKWSACGGPSNCGGCWSCRGGGGMNCWVPPPPQPMCCPGPLACRGCNGCKIVRESKFSYEEYPPSACAIM